MLQLSNICNLHLCSLTAEMIVTQWVSRILLRLYEHVWKCFAKLLQILDLVIAGWFCWGLALWLDEMGCFPSIEFCACAVQCRVI